MELSRISNWNGPKDKNNSNGDSTMSNARNLGNITAGGAVGATTASVTTSINNLIDSSPGALNTLNELAAALGDDANFSTTVTNSIATKLPLAGGTMTGDIAMGLHQIVFDNNSQAIQIKDAGGTASYVLYQDNADTLIIGNGTTVEKIRLDTSGNEGAVVIDTNGNVGIGTTAPDQPLQVKGTIETQATNSTNGFMMYTYTDNTYRINYNGAGADELILTSGGALGLGNTPGAWSANYPALQIGQGATFTGHRNNTQTQLGQNWWIGTGNQYVVDGAASRLIMNPDSTIIFSQAPSGTAGATMSTINDRLVIAPDGNVGIGNTSPGQLLEVTGSGATIRVESTDNNQEGIEFYQNNTKNASIMWGQGNANLEIKNFRNDQHASNLYANIDFFTGGSNATSPNYNPNLVMRITDDGNAHLSGQIDARIQLSSSGGANLVSDNTVYVRGNDDTAILNSAANGDIKLSENGTTRLFIKRTTGNVGIGTNNPGAKLHVSATSVPAANTTDTDELVRFTVDGNTHGRIDLHTTAKNSTRRSTVFRPSSGTAYGFGISAYNMGTLDLGRVDQGYTWNGTNGDGEYTGGITQQPRYTRKAHFGGQIIGNNTYYTIAENMNDTRFTIECFCGDASSRDYKKYAGYYTSTGYGVYGLNQLLHSNGSWNSGSFDLRVSAPNGNLSIDLRFSSYYNSSNIASWMCIYTAYV